MLPDQSVPRRRELLAALAAPLRSFLSTRRAAPGCCSAATAIALVWANSPLSDSYQSLWSTDLSIRIGSNRAEPRSRPLGRRRPDGVHSSSSSGWRSAASCRWASCRTPRGRIPGIAAVGGMVVPALLYLALNPPARRRRLGRVIGTDTAFLLGALALVGPGAQPSCASSCSTLAIADDIGAIAVIGAVYSDSIDLVAGRRRCRPAS